MARPAHWPPRLLRHKSGRARAYWQGHDYWFGKHGTKEADAAYADWVRAGPPEPGATAAKRNGPLTVAEALERYDGHARRHYRHPDGRPTGEMGYVRAAGAVLLAVCPSMRADAFRGRALKEVRRAMIAKGWCRSNTNHHVNVVKRIWKWLASEELVSAEAYGSVRAVEALKAGRTDAPESPPVLPAPLADVEAALPHLTPHLRACVRLQLLTACRPGEAVTLDPCEIDRTGAVWLWRPAAHKTAYRGKPKVILVGPKAQEVLAPLLADHEGGLLFDPGRSEMLRRAQARKDAKIPRKTPLLPRYRRKGGFTVHGYQQSVKRACKKAGVPAWHPSQLRHNALTALVERFGWQVARLVAGHSSLGTTKGYVAESLGPAIAAIGQVG